jgi:hypothetical protein
LIRLRYSNCAIFSLEKCIEVHGDSARYRLMLAMAYKQIANHKVAEDEFQAAAMRIESMGELDGELQSLYQETASMLNAESSSADRAERAETP